MLVSILMKLKELKKLAESCSACRKEFAERKGGQAIEINYYIHNLQSNGRKLSKTRGYLPTYGVQYKKQLGRKKHGI